MNRIWVALLCCSLVSCDLIEFKKDDEVDAGQPSPIARVKDSFLYQKDVEGLVPSGTSPTDSADIIGRHVNNWIKKQLVIKEAEENINFDEADHERKILDYRYALIIHEFESYYVNNRLDVEVSQEEIDQYYEDNKDNFVLKQNIIKGVMVQVPKEAPNQRRLRRWVQSSRDKEREELKSYCYRYGKFYHIEDTTWVNFNDLIKYTPWVNHTNKLDFLRRVKFAETQDDTFNYYLSIREFKISDETSPIEFVSGDIEKIIINKRKVKLAAELEADIYEKAEQKNEFEVYSVN